VKLTTPIEEPEISGNAQILPEGPNNVSPHFVSSARDSFLVLIPLQDVLLDAIDSNPDQEEESKEKAEMASTGTLPGLEGCKCLISPRFYSSVATY
jgi:hypothetical protein